MQTGCMAPSFAIVARSSTSNKTLAIKHVELIPLVLVPFNAERCAIRVFSHCLFRFCVHVRPYNAIKREVGILLRCEDVESPISASGIFYSKFSQVD